MELDVVRAFTEGNGEFLGGTAALDRDRHGVTSVVPQQQLHEGIVLIDLDAVDTDQDISFQDAGVVGRAARLDGDNDLVVRVEETKLKGACDFLIVPCSHGDMLDDPHVRRCVRRFLQEGCFESADKRMPLIEPDKPADGSQAAP